MFSILQLKTRALGNNVLLMPFIQWFPFHLLYQLFTYGNVDTFTLKLHSDNTAHLCEALDLLDILINTVEH